VLKRESMSSGTAHDLAKPESDAPPSLMLEYQKSRRRRIALGLGDCVGVRCVEY
jgi:hypothetical protein